MIYVYRRLHTVYIYYIIILKYIYNNIYTIYIIYMKSPLYIYINILYIYMCVYSILITLNIGLPKM